MKARDYLVVFSIISAPLASMWVSAWFLNLPNVLGWLEANKWAVVPLRLTQVVYMFVGIMVCVGAVINFMEKKEKL